MSEFKYDFNPAHPDADENGFVRMPNVEVVQEMVDMMSAFRAYEANITAINTFKDMAVKTLEIGRT
jgi:flagellar basal-body rod protein FlgC